MVSTLALSAFGLAACAAATPIRELREAHATTVQEWEDGTAREALCAARRISVSPGGSRIALIGQTWLQAASRFDAPSDVVGVLKTECISGTGDCQVTGLRTRHPPSDLSWSLNDKTLFLVSRRSTLMAAIDTMEPQATVRWTELRHPSDQGRALVLRYAGPTRSTSLADETARYEAALTALDSTAPQGLEAVGTLGPSGLLDFGAYLNADFSWLSWTGARRNSAPEPRVPAIFPVVTPGGAKRFIAQGALFDGEFAPIETPSYARPVFGSQSGHLVGLFDERNVYLETASSAATLAQVPGDWHYRDVASAGGGIVISLLGDARGNAALMMQDGHRAFQRQVSCQSREQLAALLAQFDQPLPFWTQGAASRTRIDTLGNADSTLPLRRYWATGEDRNLAIYLRGGPSGNLGYSTLRPSLGGLLALGYDVAAPEYSGATGVSFELASRLAVSGPEALERDVDLVVAWAAQEISRHRYRRCLVYGESFGALAAVLFARHPRQPCDTVVLVAPWLVHRNPPTWTRQNPEGSFDPAYQIVMEASVLGIDRNRNTDRFRGWMDNLRQEVLRARNVYVFFGERDLLSRREDLMQIAAQTAVVTVVPNATHSTIVSQNALWATLAALD